MAYHGKNRYNYCKYRREVFLNLVCINSLRVGSTFYLLGIQAGRNLCNVASRYFKLVTLHDVSWLGRDLSCVDVRWTWQTKASLRHFSTLKTNSHRDISQTHKAHIEIHRNYSSKAMAEYGSYDWIWSVDQWPGIPSRRETRCTGSCSSTTGHNSEGATAQIERFFKEVNCTWTVLLWDIVTCSQTQL